MVGSLTSRWRTGKVAKRILPDNLPDWASPWNWLSPEGHADLKNPVDYPSLYNLCSFPLKLFKDEAEIMSSLDEFHLLTILSEKKCCIAE